MNLVSIKIELMGNYKLVTKSVGIREDVMYTVYGPRNGYKKAFRSKPEALSYINNLLKRRKV